MTTQAVGATQKTQDCLYESADNVKGNIYVKPIIKGEPGEFAMRISCRDAGIPTVPINQIYSFTFIEKPIPGGKGNYRDLVSYAAHGAVAPPVNAVTNPRLQPSPAPVAPKQASGGHVDSPASRPASTEGTTAVKPTPLNKGESPFPDANDPRKPLDSPATRPVDYTRLSIERQTALKAAVEFAGHIGNSKMDHFDVIRMAGDFERYLATGEMPPVTEAVAEAQPED